VTGAHGKLEKKKRGSMCNIEILVLLRNAGSSMGQDFYYSYNSMTNDRRLGFAEGISYAREIPYLGEKDVKSKG